MEDTLERMRADWNRRAAEDAHYYVAFGRRKQDEEEFFATARDVVRGLTAELPRLAARDAALEIGCGPGRLMRPMARYFGEIHGVDVSDEMIRLARERLRDIPHAHPQRASGSDLAAFPEARFNFVYSYAVFQHIPSREVVFQYLREAWRVLKPGGVLRCQLNGLPATAKQYDTWSGVRIAPEEVRSFAREQGFQLLALEDIWTQYMWVTMRKPVVQAHGLRAGDPAIRNISNALTGEPAVPNSGPSAAISIFVSHWPAGVDLNGLAVTADGLACRRRRDEDQRHRAGRHPHRKRRSAACAAGPRRHGPNYPRRPCRAAHRAGDRRREPSAEPAHFERHSQGGDARPGAAGGIRGYGGRTAGARTRRILHGPHQADVRVQFPPAGRHRAGRPRAAARGG